jgi:hypothetical protein
MCETKVVEAVKANISRSIILFPKIVPVYEIMWKNVVQPDRPLMRL